MTTTARSEETPVAADAAASEIGARRGAGDDDAAVVVVEEAADVGAGDAVAGTVVLGVCVEPSGPAAERGVAIACAGSSLSRDAGAPLGRPAAAGELVGGEAALAALVHAAALALDETDLHLTVRRR